MFNLLPFGFGSLPSKVICISVLLSLFSCKMRTFNKPGASVKSSADLAKNSVLNSDVVDPTESTILQAFDYTMPEIKRRIPEIAESGFTHIQISPINLTIADKAWWGRYQPLDFRLIDGPLGNENDARELIAEARKYGISILVDLVLNHMANLQWKAGEKASYPPFGNSPYFDPVLERRLIDTLKEAGVQPKATAKHPFELFNETHFHKTGCIGGTEWLNRAKVIVGRLCMGDGDLGLPDLDGHSPDVKKAQFAFLKKLRSLGFGGYRVDALKVMHEDVVKDFFADPEVRGGMFVYGENATFNLPTEYSRHFQPFLELMTDPKSGSRTFGLAMADFPLAHQIKKAFEKQSGPSLGDSENLALITHDDLIKKHDSLPDDLSVTWVFNHDNVDGTGPFGFAKIVDPQLEIAAHGFILGRAQGLPLIYTDIREDNKKYNNFHKNPWIKGMVKFRRKMKGLSQQWWWRNDKNTLLFSRGNRFFVAINSSHQPILIGNKSFFNPNSNHVLKVREREVGLADGTYVNTLANGNPEATPITVVVKNGEIINFALPPKQTVMFEKVN